MTAAAGRHVDPVEGLAVRFWIRWPRAVIRRFPSAYGVAGDGHVLTALPPLAVLAPIAVLLGSFVIGAGRLGYEEIYTESLLVMTVFVVIGVLSSQLGVLAVTGFALGDFFIGSTSGSLTLARMANSGEPFSQGLLGDLARIRIPLLITYLLLAVAVVVLPRTARMLLLAVGRWRRIPTELAWPLASGLFVVIIWIGLNTWVAAGPILVRPRFTWLGGVPTREAIQPLQAEGDQLLAMAVVAAIVRQMLYAAALWWPPVRDQVRRAEADAVVQRPGAEQGGLAQAGPAGLGVGRRLLGDIAASALATLVLAGVLERLWLWVLAFGVFLTVRLLRSGVLAVGPLNIWKTLVVRVPAVVRVVLLWIIARVTTDALAGQFINSYTGVALVVIAGAVVVFLIFPGTPRPVPGDPSPSAPPQGPTPAPTS